MRFSAEENIKKYLEEDSKNKELNEYQILQRKRELKKVEKALQGLNKIFASENAISTEILEQVMKFIALNTCDNIILVSKLGIDYEHADAFIYAHKFGKDGRAGIGLFYSYNTELFYRVCQLTGRWLPLIIERYNARELKKLYRSYEPYLNKIVEYNKARREQE